MSRLFLLCAIVVCARAAEFDIVIRNARVVDGTGNPWYHADVAVRDGRIAKIGSVPPEAAYRVIEAAGRVLAPGFIDVHTHVESSIDKRPRADSLILDGVTTIVTGNCGGSKLNLAEWFAELEKLGLGPNVASLIGHNTVRREVMGTANRTATPDEIDRMQQLVEKAMREGAVGFSTGLIYIPGTYSNPEEVIALGKIAGKHGGVYASHMRDEGAKITEAIDEAAAVGKAGSMPVQLSHFKIDNQRLWGSSTKSLALVEKYREEGLDIVVDQYPYDHSSTNLGITLPSWALSDGEEKVKERLKDPGTRAKIITEMEQMNRDLGRDGYTYATVARFEPDRSYEGKTITEIAAMQGNPKNIRGEIDTILDIYSRGSAQMVYHSMGDEDIEAAGRAIDWADIRAGRAVAMLTANLAEEYWENPRDAIGKRIRMPTPSGLSPWFEVVGVVGDVRDNGVSQDAPPVVFLPLATSTRSLAFAIRTNLPPASLLPQARAAVGAVNPNLPLANVRTLDDILDRSMARTSFTLVTLTIAAAVALALGLVGLYGVIASIVGQRTHEIGVRMALGATRRDVSRMVLRRGMILAGAGVIVGLVAAVGLTRLMSSLLYGVQPTDPITFAAVATSLLAVAFVASYLPASRASRTDPLVALRFE
jgi:N-acyl-D-amino-acid deacylase